MTGLNSKAQVELCDFVIRTSEQEKSSAFTMRYNQTNKKERRRREKWGKERRRVEKKKLSNTFHQYQSHCCDQCVVAALHLLGRVEEVTKCNQTTIRGSHSARFGSCNAGA